MCVSIIGVLRCGMLKVTLKLGFMGAVSEAEDCFPLLALIGLTHVQVRVFEPVRPVRKNPWSWYRSYLVCTLGSC